MSWVRALFIYSTVFLSAITVGLLCYWWILSARLKKLLKKVPTAVGNGKPFSPETPAIMRYSEYKHRYGSRARDIAILATTKQKETISMVQDFTNTMREHGSLLYHFTHYWGMSNPKTVQKQMNEVVSGKYHALATLGLATTRLAQHTTVTQNKLLPTVFMGVRDLWASNELPKRISSHITGITGSSGWPIRIRVYLQIKPTMKSALIPVSQTCVQSDIDEVAELLNNYGVRPHVVKIHDAPDVLNTIADFADKVDSLIPLRNGIMSHITHKISTLCAQHNITYFSAFLDDVHNGAAVAVSTPIGRIGWHAAHKMISILENHKLPSEIPYTNIGTDVAYEAHFNQLAMRAQGLDPAILTSFSLHHGTRVHVTIPIDKT